ncbi:hypothetical protein Tco_0892860 [Tanacetum coccineum]|uniref:Gag-Pol polyprotein n=1 Tax=Tanacetum coccineum TaxID=301880 RepID=A0ABQ5CA37_9ASTR
MTTPITTTTSNSQMHNDIMAAGSKDRPPMLATGRYAQWQSRFMRYVDTKSNKKELKKCIFDVPEHTVPETYENALPENRAYIDVEAEAIHLILTGIGDDIYSTVDACTTAKEMWIAIERLQQGESLNKKDVKTNLFWEFGKFTSRDGESIESYYSRFYKMMNEMVRNKLEVVTMQVNYQNEVNEIRAEKLATNANPLALVVAAQHYPDDHYQTSKSHKTYAPSSRQTSPSRSHASTRTKGKEIAKPVTPPSESASDEDSNPKQAHKDKEMQSNLALIAKYFKKIYKPTNNNFRTSSNTKNKTMDNSPSYGNDRQSGQFGNQRTVTVVGAMGICRKSKWVKDYAYHKEKMMLCKQEEKGVPLRAKQGDWLDDTDEEPDEQELEAHYMYMAKIQEVITAESGPNFVAEPLEKVQSNDDYSVFANERQHSEQPESINDKYVVEKVDRNVIPDSSDMYDTDGKDDQNAKEYEDERVVLANLIANLKLDTDENKKIQKQLKKANASLAHELKVCKSALTESNDVRDRCRSALHHRELELEKYKMYENCQIEKDDLGSSLVNPLYLKKAQSEKPYLYQVPYDKDDIANIFTPSSDETLILEEDNLQYVQSLEKKLDELQSGKTEFSNKYDLLLQECLSKYILCVALISMTYINKYSEMACKYLEKIKECERLEIELFKQTENVSKEVYIELLRSFAKIEKHTISLELALQ